MYVFPCPSIPSYTPSPSTLILHTERTPPNTPPLHSYRYNIAVDGTFHSRTTFAYASPGFPDGIHTDALGNVYAGCGDGVHVWNPEGTLIGKIFLGTTSANFRFAGKGRMVIAAETELWFATLAVGGVDPKGEF